VSPFPALLQSALIIWRFAMPEQTSAKKPGIKTTEFWLVVVGALITVFNKGLGFDLPEEAILSLAGMIGSYVGGRSWIKTR
jgi:hypothetical protein